MERDGAGLGSKDGLEGIGRTTRAFIGRARSGPRWEKLPKEDPAEKERLIPNGKDFQDTLGIY